MNTGLQAEMLGNRLRKNYRRLQVPFEREGVGAFRLYDWDVPEIRAAVDWYEGHLVVAEYEREQTRSAAGWLEAMGAAAASALGVEGGRVHLKVRRTRPRTGERYPRLGQTGERLAVRERGLRFWVNLTDHVDTGLFPDHRETRARVRAEARDFLARSGPRFGLCVLDPPSFSTRAGASPFDVQRDHRALVLAALGALLPGGVLYFSTNHQRFEPRLEGLRAEEITRDTAPP